MITIRRSEDRGHADHGWLHSHHTFSFADYHDPKFHGFRSLRVLNDDRVMGGMGFGTHGHRDMEIISYVVSGTLEHKDSMGHVATMKAGDVQRISAGTGIQHSEYNPSPKELVHFLQIWIIPDERGVKPEYAERSFGNIEPGALQLIAAKGGRDGAISIHQETDVYVAKLGGHASVEHPLAPGRAAWVQLIAGDLEVNGAAMLPGDGAAIEGEQSVRLAAGGGAHFLFFDLN
ncbi:MAG TPA: pirin family protein [Bryobacteraceae bacterium]|nr:pirin family protein [Bryobacteraceae bacterium]